MSEADSFVTCQMSGKALSISSCISSQQDHSIVIP